MQLSKLSYSKVFIAAIRELLGKNKSGSEKATTIAPTDLTSEETQISLRSPQGATILGAEAQSRLNSDLTTLESERILSNVVGESMNEDSRKHIITAKHTGQDLGILNQFDHELEFPRIEKQL